MINNDHCIGILDKNRCFLLGFYLCISKLGHRRTFLKKNNILKVNSKLHFSKFYYDLCFVILRLICIVLTGFLIHRIIIILSLQLSNSYTQYTIIQLYDIITLFMVL